MLLGLFAFELAEMDPWIFKVIPGGSQVTPRDGAIPREGLKKRVPGRTQLGRGLC